LATTRKKSSTRKKASTRTKSTTRKYGPKAQEKVERAMHEMKEGELTSGSSGEKVTDPKQAIAIGLSEARRSGAQVPPAPDSVKKPARKKR
jgi:hypothetical protein